MYAHILLGEADVLISVQHSQTQKGKDVSNRNMCDVTYLTFSLQKTVKLKAEARLDLLRQVGVAVDTWLKSAMNQVWCF